MSEPSTFEFAVIAIRTGPTTFTKLCGIQTTGFNRAAQTTDRYVRDCDFPGRPPERKVRTTGKARTLTGSGLFNTAQIDLMNDLEGQKREFQFILMDIADPDVPEGTEIGTYEGPGVVTALNLGQSETDMASVDITIESDGVWTYTPADD